MKRICLLLWISGCTLLCAGQGKTSLPGELKTNATGQPKIIAKKVFTDHGTFVGAIGSGMQDKEGNIWFNTSYQGVYRYDGKLFTHFEVNDGMHNRGSSVMMEDKNGNIWVGANDGVYKYNGQTGFTSEWLPDIYGASIIPDLKNDGERFGQSQWVGGGISHKDGSAWFWKRFGIYRYNGKSLAAALAGVSGFLNGAYGPGDDTYQASNILDIYEDTKGNTWISVGSCTQSPSLNETYRLDVKGADDPCVLGSCRHDLRKQQDMAAHNKEIARYFVKITTKENNQSIQYTAILEDRAGNMWFGTYEGGVYRYDGKYFAHLPGKDGFDKSYVTTIYEDKTGKVWFGTGAKSEDGFEGRGVYSYDGRAVAHYMGKDGLLNKGVFHNNSITCITEDNAGKVWFGGDGGVCNYDGKTFTNFTTKDGLGDNPVYSIIKDKAGNLWIGADEMRLYRYDGKSITCFTDNEHKD